MRLMPIPLVGGALSLGLEAALCLGGGGSLDSQFTDRSGCDPPWIIVWPGASQH